LPSWSTIVGVATIFAPAHDAGSRPLDLTHCLLFQR